MFLITIISKFNIMIYFWIELWIENIYFDILRCLVDSIDSIYLMEWTMRMKTEGLTYIKGVWYSQPY